MILSQKGKNLYIVDKTPQMVRQIEVNKDAAVLSGPDGILNKGIIDLQKELHACLFCRQLNNITFITKSADIYSSSLILSEEKDFEEILKQLKTVALVELSEQNAKINGYAASVVEKLKEGITVTIMETKEEKIKCCPVCGMQCDPNIPFCMECGTPV